MKLRIIKDSTAIKDATTFIVTATMTAKVMYELQKYGIEQFDSCRVDFNAGEIIAVAKSEQEALEGD